VAGDEVVEVYLAPPVSETAPKKELVGFARTHLAAGASKDVTVTIDPRQLSLVDATGKRAIVAGEYRVFVGGRQPASSDFGLKLEITGTKSLEE
jgi:beta-glucosidase